MPLRLAGLMLIALLLASCSSDDTSGAGASGKVRFIALGDTGSGGKDANGKLLPQGQVAQLIEQVCAARGCDFAMIAGDNIYERGATSVDDPLFQAAFEQPYANLDFPFFMALGNHDNTSPVIGELVAGDGGSNERGNVQVDYHYAAVNTTKKWQMPDRYYASTWPPNSSEPLIELITLDANPVTHFVEDVDAQWRGGALDQYIAEQTVFVQDQLAASRARWKFALAHHPYLSNGQHGNAGDFEREAVPDFCAIPLLTSATCRGVEYRQFLRNTICNQVDVFFSGHDHELYWLQPTSACGKTEFIVSGAGGKERSITNPGRNPVFYQSGDHYGFFWVEIDGDRFTAAAYRIGLDGAPADVDGAGKPVPAFERSFQRTPS